MRVLYRDILYNLCCATELAQRHNLDRRHERNQPARLLEEIGKREVREAKTKWRFIRIDSRVVCLIVVEI